MRGQVQVSTVSQKRHSKFLVRKWTYSRSEQEKSEEEKTTLINNQSKHIVQCLAARSELKCHQQSARGWSKRKET